MFLSTHDALMPSISVRLPFHTASLANLAPLSLSPPPSGSTPSSPSAAVNGPTSPAQVSIPSLGLLLIALIGSCL